MVWRFGTLLGLLRSHTGKSQYTLWWPNLVSYQTLLHPDILDLVKFVIYCFLDTCLLPDFFEGVCGNWVRQLSDFLRLHLQSLLKKNICSFGQFSTCTYFIYVLQLTTITPKSHKQFLPPIAVHEQSTITNSSYEIFVSPVATHGHSTSPFKKR